MLIDSHCHLDSVDNLDSVIDRAQSEGIGKIIAVGTSIKSSKKVLEIAEQRRVGTWIYAAIGIHPQDGRGDIDNYGSLENCINELRKILKQVQDDKAIVGIGECGLDYYLTTDPSTSSGQLRQLTTNKERAFQKELFREQVKLAAQLKLPLVIHCRNAFDEILNLLSDVSGQLSNVAGVFHSWTGDWNTAKKALDLGFYISFSGIVTFKQSLRSSTSSAGLKNTKDIQEVAKKMPFDRMLIETDSPFLSPEPMRGKINEPKNVKIVAQFIADLRGLPFDKIAEMTSRNATQLFGI